MGKLIVILIIAGLLYLLYKELEKEGGFSVIFCIFGYHEFDSWKYTNENNCEKKRACSICGEFLPNSDIKIEHVWTTVYLKDKSCEKQESCLRCGEKRGKIFIKHSWSESFVGKNSNKKWTVCKRCKTDGGIRISQNKWPWVFDYGNLQDKYLILQSAIKQISLSDDIFWVVNNSRDTKVSITSSCLPNTNLIVFGFNIETLQLMFYPDGICEKQNRLTCSTMLYKDLTLNIFTINVESSIVPKDGDVVGQTWLHSRKDGGPDLRYNNNPSISIISYALMEFGTPQKGKYRIAISNKFNAQNLYNKYNDYRKTYLGSNQRKKHDYQKSYSHNSQQGGRKSTGSNKRQQYNTSNKFTMTTARSILGVGAGASKDEIRKAYFDLVKKYHPDKVFNLADEYKVIAERKMKEINAAYSMLKGNGG